MPLVSRGVGGGVGRASEHGQLSCMNSRISETPHARPPGVRGTEFHILVLGVVEAESSCVVHGLLLELR